MCVATYICEYFKTTYEYMYIFFDVINILYMYVTIKFCPFSLKS